MGSVTDAVISPFSDLEAPLHGPSANLFPAANLVCEMMLEGNLLVPSLSGTLGGYGRKPQYFAFQGSSFKRDKLVL